MINLSGGTGYIGSCISTALHNLNIKTTIISRTPGIGRITWQDLESNGLPKDTNAVINVTGLNILDFKQRWTKEFKQNILNSRIQTSKNLAKALQNIDTKVFITISGVSYYPADGKEYSENDKCEKYDFFSELCHNLEAATELSEQCLIRTVNIRSGIVLGRTGGMIKQIFLPFYFGLGGPLGSGKQYMPWIHIKDLVNLFIHVLKKESITGILNGVAPQIITNNEFTQAFASSLKRPAILPIPAVLLKTVLNEERAKIVLECPKVLPIQVLKSGFNYQYPTIKEACDQFGILVYKSEPF
ncbi:PREDICTED: epimerase family protein SDR39U1 [Ceratosolen solmsi marchali]|uniref:Epimerase family protein SDR39U1 n=1 Tax=Ceratosolen solmsi marchali TaxID=326594 RepID=A0AAJ7E2T4_9HYME|nr:PREDICTED: epimerase family protein SDR39U1 [Ceratosolen solmsi marchali]